MVFAVRALWERKVSMTALNASLALRVTNVITRVWASSSALLDPTHWKATTLPVLLALQVPTAPPFMTPQSPVPRGLIPATELPIVRRAPLALSAWTRLRVQLLVAQGAIVLAELPAAPLVQVEATVLKRIPVPSLAPRGTTRLVGPHPAPNVRLEIIVLIKDHRSSVHLERIPFPDLKPAKCVPKATFALFPLS
jgi:hypothetical protein